MEQFGIAGVAAITVIVYVLGSAVKATRLANRWIPVICGGAGGVLGAVSLYVMPEFPAVDIINAVAIGMVSGLAATGVNQVCKQLHKCEGAE